MKHPLATAKDGFSKNKKYKVDNDSKKLSDRVKEYMEKSGIIWSLFKFLLLKRSPFYKGQYDRIRVWLNIKNGLVGQQIKKGLKDKTVIEDEVYTQLLVFLFQEYEKIKPNFRGGPDIFFRFKCMINSYSQFYIDEPLKAVGNHIELSRIIYFVFKFLENKNFYLIKNLAGQGYIQALEYLITSNFKVPNREENNALEILRLIDQFKKGEYDRCKNRIDELLVSPSWEGPKHILVQFKKMIIFLRDIDAHEDFLPLEKIVLNCRTPFLFRIVIETLLKKEGKNSAIFNLLLLLEASLFVYGNIQDRLYVYELIKEEELPLLKEIVFSLIEAQGANQELKKLFDQILQFSIKEWLTIRYLIKSALNEKERQHDGQVFVEKVDLIKKNVKRINIFRRSFNNKKEYLLTPSFMKIKRFLSGQCEFVQHLVLEVVEKDMNFRVPNFIFQIALNNNLRLLNEIFRRLYDYIFNRLHQAALQLKKIDFNLGEEFVDMDKTKKITALCDHRVTRHFLIYLFALREFNDQIKRDQSAMNMLNQFVNSLINGSNNISACLLALNKDRHLIFNPISKFIAIFSWLLCRMAYLCNADADFFLKVLDHKVCSRQNRSVSGKANQEASVRWEKNYFDKWVKIYYPALTEASGKLNNQQFRSALAIFGFNKRCGIKETVDAPMFKQKNMKSLWQPNKKEIEVFSLMLDGFSENSKRSRSDFLDPHEEFVKLIS